MGYRSTLGMDNRNLTIAIDSADTRFVVSSGVRDRAAGDNAYLYRDGWP